MYLQNKLTFSLYLQEPINNTEDTETTAIGANASNENDITDVEGVEENNVSEEENDSAGGEG